MVLVISLPERRKPASGTALFGNLLADYRFKASFHDQFLGDITEGGKAIGLTFAFNLRIDEVDDRAAVSASG